MHHKTNILDKVIFAARKAFAVGGADIELHQSPDWNWIEGTVTGVDIISQVDYYAVYECSFNISGKTRVCYILKDDDKHIAHVDTNPRERLFGAVEQDCTLGHLEYLANFHSIDVSTFRDLVLAKAIEFASYHTLLWLKNEFSVDCTFLTHHQQNGSAKKNVNPRHAGTILIYQNIRFCPQERTIYRTK